MILFFISTLFLFIAALMGAFFLLKTSKVGAIIITAMTILGTIFNIVSYVNANNESNKTRSDLIKTNIELGNIKRYGSVAKLGIYGVEALPGFGIALQGGLYDFLKNNYKQEGGVDYPICGSESEGRFKKVIEINSDFPFSYYALAFCKLERGEKDARDYAKKAIEIFKITTTIGGHNSYHDVALEKLLSRFPQI